MTYKDMFVAEVKTSGKILRVKDGKVSLPFGSEYTLLLKNLNSKRASVQVSIDGEDTLDNHSLVLEANSETELEGFLRGSVARNRFKFIDKTQKIQDHRGDKADDGLIRIEFAFEKPQPEPQIKEVIKEVHHHYPTYYPWSYTYYGSYPDWNNNDNFTSKGGDSDDSDGVSGGTMQCYSSNVKCNVAQASAGPTVRSLGVENVSAPLEDEGITVKGSECHQDFRYTSIGQLEESKVIVIQLRGLLESGNPIKEPISVKTKLVCSSCGTKSNSSYKFCPDCGTFLE